MDRIEAIKSDKGEHKYKLLGIDSKQNYYIIMQLESDKKSINNIRIIKKSDATIHIKENKKTIVSTKKYIYYAGKESI